MCLLEIGNDWGYPANSYQEKNDQLGQVHVHLERHVENDASEPYHEAYIDVLCCEVLPQQFINRWVVIHSFSFDTRNGVNGSYSVREYLCLKHRKQNKLNRNQS